MAGAALLGAAPVPLRVVVRVVPKFLQVLARYFPLACLSFPTRYCELSFVHVHCETQNSFATDHPGADAQSLELHVFPYMWQRGVRLPLAPFYEVLRHKLYGMMEWGVR